MDASRRTPGRATHRTRGRQRTPAGDSSGSVPFVAFEHCVRSSLSRAGSCCGCRPSAAPTALTPRSPSARATPRCRIREREVLRPFPAVCSSWRRSRWARGHRRAPAVRRDAAAASSIAPSVDPAAVRRSANTPAACWFSLEPFGSSPVSTLSVSRCLPNGCIALARSVSTCLAFREGRTAGSRGLGARFQDPRLARPWRRNAPFDSRSSSTPPGGATERARRDGSRSHRPRPGAATSRKRPAASGQRRYVAACSSAARASGPCATFSCATMNRTRSGKLA